jgi:Tfp pilus assembly protein PilX
MRMRDSHSQLHHDQHGAALAIALIFLLIIALLGALSLNTSFLESLMASNSQFHNRALHDAEYLLRIAEKDVSSVVANGSPLQSHYHLPGESGIDPSIIQWPGWNDDSVSRAISRDGINGAYTIEYLGPVYESEGDNIAIEEQAETNNRISYYLFRISALAIAGKGSQRILQSLYRTVEGVAP